MFFWNSCFFDDPEDVGNLSSGSSAFAKTNLNIWKFTVHILLNPGLENFEHYFASMWDEYNYVIAFLNIVLLFHLFQGILKNFLSDFSVDSLVFWLAWCFKCLCNCVFSIFLPIIDFQIHVLWLENMLDIISIFLNLLRLALWLSCVLSGKLPCVQKRMCIQLFWMECPLDIY